MLGKSLKRLLIGSAATLWMAATAHAQILRDYSEQPRRLIVCVFDSSVMTHGFADEQMKSADWPGYAERDLIITTLSRFRAATHVATALGPITTELGFTSVEREREARRYGCETGENSVLLIGRDGLEKRRWAETVQNGDLFALIDAMPMRRQEMREQAGEG